MTISGGDLRHPLTTREGWAAFVSRARPEPPRLLPGSDLERLTAVEREIYHEAGAPLPVRNTSGDGCPVSAQKARTARMPPMPSSSSCRSRWSLPPPYSRSVTSCRSGSFSST